MSAGCPENPRRPAGGSVAGVGTLATVRELWRFPVKSMQGERVGAAVLGPAGLDGDRRYALRRSDTGQVLSAKRYGELLQAAASTDADGGVRIRLPDGTELAATDPSVHQALSDFLGLDVRLEAAAADEPAAYQMAVDPLDEGAPVIEIPCPPGTFLDAAAAHLLTTASLEAARRLHPDGEWDVRRFRPTALLEADDPEASDGFAEDGWIGEELWLGEATLTVFAPTVRCAMPTRPQPGLASDPDIARTTRDHHGSNLGVYAAVSSPGEVAEGDSLTVLT